MQIVTVTVKVHRLCIAGLLRVSLVIMLGGGRGYGAFEEERVVGSHWLGPLCP